MSLHKPIKFEQTLEPSAVKDIKQLFSENKTAKTILNATLAIIATGGILTIGATMPNLLGLFYKFNKKMQNEKRAKYRQIWQSFNALKKQQAVEFVREDKDGNLIYRLSDKGKQKVKKFMFKEMTIKKPKNWDGKWRLVIFDIPEKFKKARNALSSKLKDLGFYQTQKSAWIHPFPCENEIGITIDLFNIKPFVKIFLVEEMTDGKTLYHFKDILKSKNLKQ